jgi:hypothetical protein
MGRWWWLCQWTAFWLLVAVVLGMWVYLFVQAGAYGA